MSHRLNSLVLLVSLLSFTVAPTQAAMIGTQQMLAAETATEQRAELETLLQRDEVKSQLSEMGVSTAMVEQRVAAMTDEEVAQLTSELEAMPAGSGLLGAAVVIFVVFVITDAIGATDIFTFVRPAN